MQINSGFILRTIGSKNIIVPIGENVRTFKGAIQINETSALIWKLIEKNMTIKEIINALSTKYIGVSEKELTEDVTEFINFLIKYKIVTE